MAPLGPRLGPSLEVTNNEVVRVINIKYVTRMSVLKINDMHPRYTH